MLLLVNLARGWVLNRAISYLINDDRREVKTYESKYPGPFNISTPHRLAEVIGSLAFTYELIALANSQDPSVRCYAFWLLAKRGKTEQVKNILRDQINDTTRFNSVVSCILEESTVGAFMGKVVTDGATFPFTQLLQQEDLDELGLRQKLVITPVKQPFPKTDCCAFSDRLVGTLVLLHLIQK